MPSDGAWEKLGLLEQFLHIVFAKMRLERIGMLVQGENIDRRLELGYCDQTDLFSCELLI